MAQSQLFGYVEVMGHWEYAAGGANAFLLYYHRSVMEWRVLEEYILYEALVDERVDTVACLDDIIEWRSAFYHNERSHLVAGHVHACHDDRHYAFLVRMLRVVFRPEESHDGCHALVCTERVEELSYLLLEQDDDGKHSDRDKLVENASEKAHLKHLADKQPDDNEHHDAYEDIQ